MTETSDTSSLAMASRETRRQGTTRAAMPSRSSSCAAIVDTTSSKQPRPETHAMVPAAPERGLDGGPAIRPSSSTIVSIEAAICVACCGVIAPCS